MSDKPRDDKLPTDTPAAVTVPALLSVATVARLLDSSPRTVGRRIAERSLGAVIDHGRVMVRGDELRAYVDRLERVRGTRPRKRPAPTRTAPVVALPTTTRQRGAA